MEIIRVIMPILLSIAEMVVESLGGEIDFVAFQEKLAKKLQEVGRAVTQAVLEGLEEQTRKDRKKRAQWQLCRRKDPKELLSRFGIIHYARSYYRNKETGKYAYLVDRFLYNISIVSWLPNYPRCPVYISTEMVSGTG